MIRRHVFDLLNGLLSEEPVVVINGARTAGKSTVLRMLGDAHGGQIFDLDDPATRSLVARDPSLILDTQELVLIDEFQHLPELLETIKASLTQELRPGRFVLSGSTRYLSTPQLSESLAGRVAIVTLWPLSQGELDGTRETFLDTLLVDTHSMVQVAPSSTSRAHYRSRVLSGGFPIAVSRDSPRSRSRWFRNYVDTVVQRDVLEIRKIRQRRLLPSVLHRLVSQTAQILNFSAIARDLELDETVARDYSELLEVVFLVHRLESWGRTLGSRMASSPKIHVTDTGLGSHLLGVTESRLTAGDPAALTEYGHLLESFAVNEILRQASWSDSQYSFGHYRTRDDIEIDLVVEAADGTVAGVEMKASSSVSGADFRGLAALKKKMGNRFAGGVVLYTGVRSYSYDQDLHVLPLDTLWKSRASPIPPGVV